MNDFSEEEMRLALEQSMKELELQEKAEKEKKGEEGILTANCKPSN
mgnify:FL=1